MGGMSETGVVRPVIAEINSSPFDVGQANILCLITIRRDIVKCCGWRRAHPDGLGGGFDVTILKFDALDDEFNEFVTV